MKKTAWLCAVALLILLAACSGKFEDVELGVPAIAVSSISIDGEGRLLTATAANKARNDPIGKNQSPQLSWDEVEGAACYAVVMFDEDANWLHWMATGITVTQLEQGAYRSEEEYIGPYPPKTAGTHNYRIEVFALRQAPEKTPGKMNAINNYADIVKGFDAPDGSSGNVLARGRVIGTYSNR